MAHRAHLNVLAPQALGVEPGPMGVVMPAAQGRVTRQAIPLGVAAYARFESLAGGAAVTRTEEPVSVMIARSQATTRDQPRLLMACSTEAAVAVAVVTR